MNLSPKNIALSLIAHAAVLALLMFEFFPSSDRGGFSGGGGQGGVTAAIWVGDAGFAKSSNDNFATAQKSRGDMPLVEDLSKRQGTGGSGSPGSLGGVGGGDGIGGGSGVGASAGAGNANGDEALAKIWREIDEKKYYPALAKKNRLEGTPKVAFEIGADGKITSASLVESCGIKLLDDAALETLRRLKSLPPYPRPITVALKYFVQ